MEIAGRMDIIEYLRDGSHVRRGYNDPIIDRGNKLRIDSRLLGITSDDLDFTLLRLSGYLTISHNGRVRRLIEEHLELLALRYAIDFSDLIFIDSAGMSAIFILISRLIRRNGPRIAAFGIQPEIRAAFSHAQILTFFDEVRDLDQARQHLCASLKKDHISSVA